MENKQGQHTPGPWRSRELGSEGARIFPDYGDIRERGKTIADVRGRDTLTDFANARLIAAAPELLALIRSYATTYPLDEYHDKATAAIAKATGGL